MAKKTTYLAVLLFISTFALQSNAQVKNPVSAVYQVPDSILCQHYDPKPETLPSHEYRIYSINLTSSWYHPEMDFFNATFLPYFQVTDRFGGNYTLGGNVTFSLPKQFRARFGVSFWKDEATGSKPSVLSSLQITFTRYRLGILYVPVKLSFGRFQPYAGIDGQFLMVRNNLVMEQNYPVLKGSSYTYAPFLGIEYNRDHFISSLEYSYNLGYYLQDICNCMGQVRNNVSVNGPELGVSVGYKF